MTRMNSKMAARLETSTAIGVLPVGLCDVLRKGFQFRDGCLFLTHFAHRAAIESIDAFPDRTGYECFVNSFHVDEFAEERFIDVARLFVDECFRSWSSELLGVRYRAIVSGDDTDVVVKIHCSRDGESWLSDDLENCDEAVLVADCDTKD